MSRVEKLYITLDELIEEYRNLLVREFDQEGHSSYLYKSCDDEHVNRPYSIHGKAGGFETANALLSLEKQIRQLCLKLKEPLPLPIMVLDEYVDAYREIKDKKTKQPWHVDDFEGEHRQLKRKMIEKLSLGKGGLK